MPAAPSRLVPCSVYTCMVGICARVNGWEARAVVRAMAAAWKARVVAMREMC